MNMQHIHKALFAHKHPQNNTKGVEVRYVPALNSYTATYDDWEAGDPVGRGWTEQEAIENLQAELWEAIADSEARLMVNGIG
jgi:hypothetical protein